MMKLKRFRAAGSSFVMLGFALCAAQAAAQIAPLNEPAGASSQAASAAADDPSGLNNIVVTARRRDERIQDVPLTITAVSSAQLARAGVTTLRDLSTIVSGYTFSGTSSNAQVAIRGVSSLVSVVGSEAPNAAYVDGVYFASATLLSTSLPDVERIEVLKGPQGTLFGRNATGGAVQIFTRDPSFKPTVAINIDAGNYDGGDGGVSSPRVNARAFVSIPLVSDLLAVSLSGGYDYTKGYFRNVATGARDGVIQKGNLRGKILLTPSSDVNIVLASFYMKNSGNGQGLEVPYNALTAAAQYPGSVIPRRPYETAYDTGVANAQYDFQRIYGFSGKITWDTDAGTLTSLTGYNNSDKVNPSTSIHFAQATLPCLLNFACIDFANHEFSREFSQELNFASRKLGILSFVAGLYYYDATGGQTGLLDPTLAAIAPGVFPIQVRNPRFSTKAYAAYGEATIAVTDQFSLIGGLRGTIEPHSDNLLPTAAPIKKTYRALTPRISAKYNFSPALNIYATYSQGYRSGLTGVTNDQTTPQYQSIKPERLTSYEVGVKYGTRDLTLNLSGFYYNYKDKQEQAFTGTGAITVNTGAVRIYGIDFDANVRLNRNLSLSGNLSYIPEAKYLNFPNAFGYSTSTIPFNPAFPPFNCAPGGGCGAYLPVITVVGGVPQLTFDASGQRLIRTPKVTASGTLAYANEGFDASATLFYSSNVFYDLPHIVRQKPYALLTAQAGYKFDGGFRIGIYGRNLTNNAAIAHALTSSAAIDAGYVPPRELGISLGYAF
jgi:iron complex outermembrane recepter protein